MVIQYVVFGYLVEVAMNGMHGRSDMGTTRRRTAGHIGITLMISKISFSDYRYRPIATRLLVISGRCLCPLAKNSQQGQVTPRYCQIIAALFRNSCPMRSLPERVPAQHLIRQGSHATRLQLALVLHVREAFAKRPERAVLWEHTFRSFPLGIFPTSP
jgi:hypothetical protein